MGKEILPCEALAAHNGADKGAFGGFVVAAPCFGIAFAPILGSSVLRIGFAVDHAGKLQAHKPVAFRHQAKVGGDIALYQQAAEAFGKLEALLCEPAVEFAVLGQRGLIPRKRRSVEHIADKAAQLN